MIGTKAIIATLRLGHNKFEEISITQKQAADLLDPRRPEIAGDHLVTVDGESYFRPSCIVKMEFYAMPEYLLQEIDKERAEEARNSAK